MKVFKIALSLVLIPASFESTLPSHPESRESLERNKRENGYKSALIILHGLASGDGLECDEMQKGLSLSTSVKVVCPTANREPELCLLNIGLVSQLTGRNPRSWYNMCHMPGQGGEYKSEIDDAVRVVESEVDKLFWNDGIPSEKIVLAGFSQGGSVALYTALHTKYKFGGFIGVITWLPLLPVEHPTWFNPVKNADTPVLHINGEFDLIVQQRVGLDTESELSKVIPDYTFLLVDGSHSTTHLNSCTWPKIANWLSEKGLLELYFVPSLPTCRLNVFQQFFEWWW